MTSPLALSDPEPTFFPGSHDPRGSWNQWSQAARLLKKMFLVPRADSDDLLGIVRLASVPLPYPAEAITQCIRAAVSSDRAKRPRCRFWGFCLAAPQLAADVGPTRVTRQAGALVAAWAPKTA